MELRELKEQKDDEVAVSVPEQEETVDNQLKNKADAASQINTEAPEEKE